MFNWLYLYYLDRELLTTCGLYGNISVERLNDDFVTCLLSVDEPCYVSTSVLFESDYAFHLFQRHREAFGRQDILRLAGSSADLCSFIQRKRHDYDHAKDAYTRYFTDVWKSIDDLGPSIAAKNVDTTGFLQRRVSSRLQAIAITPPPPGTLSLSDDKLLCVVQQVTDILSSSGQKPVTAKLFQSAIPTDQTGDAVRNLIGLQISLSYVESYINDYGGSIPTGLKCGLRRFDILSRTYPGHHLVIWRDIYSALGLYPEILAHDVGVAIRIRDSEWYPPFVAAVRTWLERHIAGAGLKHSTMEDSAIWQLYQDLLKRLRPFRRKATGDFVSSTVETLQRCVCANIFEVSERPPVAKETEYTVRLETRTGTLLFSDGRRLVLDSATFRVLFALAYEVRGLGQAGVMGYLKDETVACLYSGERLPSSANMTGISYQFTRALRRQLAKIGVMERDAVVRREHGNGIAIGTKWARSALKGNSEVSLVFGHDADRHSSPQSRDSDE